MLMIVGAIIGTFAVLYFGFAIFFMSHFSFGTSINGIKVATQSTESVKYKIRKGAENYVLSIVPRTGSKEEIVAEDIALSIESTDEVIEALLKKQNGFAWPMYLFQPQSFETETMISFDEAKLASKVASLNCMKESLQKEPEDAKLSEYDEQKGFTIISAVPGTKVDKDAFLKQIKEAIQSLDDTLDMDEKECYVKPKVSDDDKNLKNSVETLNKALETVITFEVGDATTTLDKTTFASWLKLDENANATVEEEPLSEFVSSQLAKVYNTCYNEEQLATSYGVTITIPNSHYGWKVDQEAERNQIREEILAGKKVNRDLNYSWYAASHSGNDYGNSYVEVNLTAQHLFLYKDGVCILESDVVTGNPSTNHETPPGVFGITYCERNATLRGPGYATPVSYWMPFNGDIGLHDGTWNPIFGAARYMRNGSHGCVNLPYATAKTIFENVQAGFPVLVYELPGTETPENLAQQRAYTVMDAIKAIGEVSLESEWAITQARAAYENLDEMARGYVANYDDLVNAEVAIAAIKG